MNDQDLTMVSLNRMYFEANRKSWDFTIGRKPLDWSMADREWSLGQLNNRVNFDFFNPGEEGLIGALLNLKTESGIKLGIFSSGVYVPELNPQTQVNAKTGEVSCKNPWCVAPSSSTDIEGRDTPIFYNVNMPDNDDVVFQYSLGGSLGIEREVWTSDDLHVVLGLNGYMIRKPENTVSLSAEVKYENDNQRVFVDVTPQFFYHDVSGLDAELDFKELKTKLYGSYIQIRPEETPKGGDLFYQYTGIKTRKINEDYISGGIKYDGDRVKVQTGYIARTSEFDKENDILVGYPRWNQAVHLALELVLTPKWNAKVDYKFDMLTEDRITTASTNYLIGRTTLGFGANIIGTDGGGESYWSDYENNDSVYTTLAYRF